MIEIEKVIQLVPAFHYGDAIGESIRNLATWLSAEGIKNEIYSLEVDAELSSEAFIYPHQIPLTNGRTVIMLHYALPSILDGIYKSLAGRKVLVYHNITPYEYFLPWSPELAFLTKAGREQIIGLRDCTELAIADSEYNRKELEEFGFKSTEVCPIWVPIDKLKKSVNSMLVQLLKGKRVFLFVGRVVPNKKIEDIIKIIYWYRENIEANSILVVVGKYGSVPRYYYWLREYGRALNYSEGELLFTGHISYEDLAAYYSVAAAFISMSEHEGFCVPLVESMYFGLPVIAYASAAVGEILGDAGILVYTKRFEYIAELLYELNTDIELRNRVIEVGRKRIDHFRDENMFKIWHNIFSYLKLK